MTAGFYEPWEDGEARVSKMVFIGKNLDAEAPPRLATHYSLLTTSLPTTHYLLPTTHYLLEPRRRGANPPYSLVTSSSYYLLPATYRNLEALAASFNGCVATPAALRAKREGLRFGVGDAVECRMGVGPDAWAAGTVVAALFRDVTAARSSNPWPAEPPI